MQADELVTSIQRNIVTVYTELTNTTIFWHVDKIDWGHFRLERKACLNPYSKPLLSTHPYCTLFP